MKGWAVLLACWASISAEAAPLCGPTVLTFWDLDLRAKQLRFKNLVRHEEEICDPESLENRNATLELLDRGGKVVREVPVFLQTMRYFDHESGGALGGGVGALEKIQLSLKFADRGFAKVRSLRIRLDGGGVYGPADF